MENDPFVSVEELCKITESAQDELGDCVFAGPNEEPANSGGEDGKGEPPEQPCETEVQSTPVTMVSLSDSPANDDPTSEEVYGTPQESALLISTDDAGEKDATDVAPSSPVNLTAVGLGTEGSPAKAEFPEEVVKTVLPGDSSPTKVAPPKRTLPASFLGKAECGQERTSEAASRPPKEKVFDVFEALKDIVECQGGSSIDNVPNELPYFVAKRSGITFPRPKWWPKDYEGPQ